MSSRLGRVGTSWSGLQRRIRRSVPAPVARTDLAVFRAVARMRVPIVGPLLPRISRAANHSRLWMAIAAVMAASGGRFGRRAALRGLLAIGATSAVTNLPAKLLTGRSRPDLAVVPEIRRLARVPASTSFPSGHSASAFAFAAAASIEQPRLRVPLYGLATAVAVSRVYTGVHYPGDVLVGSAIGVAVARLTTRPWPLADQRPAEGEPVDLDPSLLGPDGAGLIVVSNVDAGNSLGPGPEARLRASLPRAEFLEVDPDEDLVSALRRAAGRASVLCVSGGDGSVNAAIGVALESGLPLALVPSGTRNHLAKNLRLEEVEATISAVERHRAIRVDVGEVDGQVFANAASLGIYPRQVTIRRRWEDRIGKWPATLWSLLRSMRTEEPTEIEIDGRWRRVWLLFLGNCQFEDVALVATRRRRLDDGVLDVRIIDADVPWARTRIVLSLLSGRVTRSRAYEHWTAPQVRLRSRGGPLRVGVDGEIRETEEEVVVRKRPRSLLILQPAAPDNPAVVDQ